MSCFTLGGGFRAAISRKRAATPRSDVRFGSKADISQCNRHVRFTPKSEHSVRRIHVIDEIYLPMAEKLKPPAFEEGFAKITVVRVKSAG